ncbi:ribosome small subunit-dependent GTPase A [Pigmentiphaga sp.]|uniref:ribosome small subunit-dependent GTPase A n=1 Tax=Pigmentiphaga sp. TaxID=1977564 RepID=UPI0025E522BA|nr:ribosome small subunit-dependent GTPase A [Pigmentiphaga sp.]
MKAPRHTPGTGLQGRVVAAFGRHFTVECDDGSTRQCYPRGKKGTAAVGDRVEVAPEGPAGGAIQSVLPRRNLLYRSDEMRTKQFAANVDQLLIVVATEPDFSDELVGRALVGAFNADISPVVILNKVDRPAGLEAARRKLAPIQALGVPVLELCARDTAATQAALAPRLAGQTSLLLGQSGMGKSTLLNALVPNALAATQEHSQALGAGKHTTTSTRLYHLPATLASGADLIDSPGFQAFGLQHLDSAQIVQGFPEFSPYLGHCRFYNCTHIHEPGCAVLEALEAGRIAPQRHALYGRLLDELLLGQRY